MSEPEVAVPRTAAQLDEVRKLMRSFLGWHRERHLQDLHLIDAYFDQQAWEAELANLPGDYAPPHGQLLLATVDGEAAGCVALRRIDAQACEMKRMFVHPRLHGRGAGRALAQAIVQEGRALGYRRMRLDTSIRQAEALGLYTALGFERAAPDEGLDPAMRDWLVFMELEL